MRRSIWICFVGMIGLEANIRPQTFTLDGGIAGGTGNLAGGNYSLEGEISHFHPAALSAGAYALETGFFSQAPVFIPLDVELIASYSDGRLMLLWDRAATGYVVETTGSLGAGAQWSELSAPLEANVTHFFVSVPAPLEDQFFRLRHP